MNQCFARVVELREEKYVKYDGKITMDSPSREFLEMTYWLRSPKLEIRLVFQRKVCYNEAVITLTEELQYEI